MKLELGNGSNMEKAVGHGISALIICFGLSIPVAGLGFSAPMLEICVAVIPIAIGVWSLFGPT